MANLSLSIESNLDSGNARDLKQGLDGIEMWGLTIERRGHALNVRNRDKKEEHAACRPEEGNE